MQVGVVGLGVVGGAVRHGLTCLGHDVAGYDPRSPGTTLAAALDTEVAFVCVPTPPRADGSCDTSVVESVVEDAARASFPGVLAVKSTVEPGTTEALAARYPTLRLAFVPEFLRERSATVDFVEHHHVLVIGARSPADADVIERAHGALPRAVARVTPTEAEVCKYFVNCLNALRVVFANEFYEVCRALGADYQAVRGAVTQIPTVGRAYLDCSEGMRGFGGVCLPKDTRAIAELVRRLSLDLGLFDAIVTENQKFPTTVPAGMRGA